jgi:hypothetical protein
MQASTTINAARARRSRSAPKPRGKGSSGGWPAGEDWLYGQALAYVRRQRCTNVNDLARELGVMHVTAKSILTRMQSEGIVGEPDLLGQQRLAEGDRHE